ncbi:MAG: apolipoprotein N-acyltransferase [Ignavibacteria bacterium]|nr:apolipoprotein N-acyltransferase [Ignavibacteria bacterium]
MEILLKNTKTRNLLLCLLGGALLGLSFPPFKTWYFVYFGLMILLFLIIDSSRLRQAFGRAFLLILVFNEISLYWISGWHSSDTFLKIGGIVSVLVNSLFMMMPLMITYGISKFKKDLAILVFPLIWVGFEYFTNQWQFAFPWLELGNTETYNLNRIQYIEFVGVHGISLLICIFTSVLYILINRLYLRNWFFKSPKAICSYLILFALIAFPNIYSNLRHDSDNSKYFSNSDSSKVVDACIVQTNTDPFKKWGGDQDKLLDTYLDGLNGGLKFNPDLLILHETATPYYFLEDYNLLKSKRFFDFVERNRKYLLMGIPHLQYYEDSTKAQNDSRKMSNNGRYYDTFNSAILIEPGKHRSALTIHKKVKLVPFSERVPYQEKLAFLKDWIKWGVGISGWQRGTENTIFKLNNDSINIHTDFATLICYESVFSEFVTEFTAKGAEYFVIVTNDGWWGNTSGPEQHNQYAVLRAIENRKWIARCAQTGVSCFIDPLGNKYDEIPYGSTGAIDRKIIANNEKTFYVLHGDIAGRVSFYVFMLGFASCFVIYAYRKTLKSRA